MFRVANGIADFYQEGRVRLIGDRKAPGTTFVEAEADDHHVPAWDDKHVVVVMTAGGIGPHGNIGPFARTVRFETVDPPVKRSFFKSTPCDCGLACSHSLAGNTMRWTLAASTPEVAAHNAATHTAAVSHSRFWAEFIAVTVVADSSHIA